MIVINFLIKHLLLAYARIFHLQANNSSHTAAAPYNPKTTCSSVVIVNCAIFVRLYSKAIKQINASQSTINTAEVDSAFVWLNFLLEVINQMPEMFLPYVTRSFHEYLFSLYLCEIRTATIVKMLAPWTLVIALLVPKWCHQLDAVLLSKIAFEKEFLFAIYILMDKIRASSANVIQINIRNSLFVVCIFIFSFCCAIFIYACVYYITLEWNENGHIFETKFNKTFIF